MREWHNFQPYVPVAERRRQAAESLEKLRKKGRRIVPLERPPRAIATSFWGKAWCTHLDSLGDYANRLPRGRTYVRNGSVVHLEMKPGKVEALVQGSALYEIEIGVQALAPKKWKALRERCSGEICSALDLLQGKLSEPVLKTITNQQRGLFPRPREIKLRCSCPDSAKLCKHIAAVLYGVGARLDHEPSLLFLLRGVDHRELLQEAALALREKKRAPSPAVENQDLSALFGIELEPELEPVKAAMADREGRRKTKRGDKNKPLKTNR